MFLSRTIHPVFQLWICCNQMVNIAVLLLGYRSSNSWQNSYRYWILVVSSNGTEITSPSARPRSAENPPHAAAAVDRRDRQMGGSRRCHCPAMPRQQPTENLHDSAAQLLLDESTVDSIHSNLAPAVTGAGGSHRLRAIVAFTSSVTDRRARRHPRNRNYVKYRNADTGGSSTSTGNRQEAQLSPTDRAMRRVS